MANPENFSKKKTCTWKRWKFHTIDFVSNCDFDLFQFIKHINFC